MIQIINIEKLTSLIKDGMSHDDLISAMQDIVNSIGKEISHIEKYVGDINLSVGSSGPATWGSITGTLSNQTDLNSVLSGKANISHSHTGYALADHNHNGVYSPIEHNHSGVYEPAISKSNGYLTWTGAAWSFKNETYSLSSHNHDGVYSLINHDHDSDYADIAHNHSGTYASVIHNFIDTTNHPVSGLTTGHFLKALSSTTYGFTAHGLTYSDVGAAASAHNHSGVYEPVISTGTTAQYFRGDKSWQTLNQAAVEGLTTSSTPTFARLGLGTAADSSAMLKASGQYYSAKYAQTYGATMTINWDNGNVQYVALTGNVTSLTLSNPKDGARYLLILKQDATGSRTVAWPGTVKWPGSTAPTLSGANKYDVIAFVWDGTNSCYYAQYSLNY